MSEVLKKTILVDLDGVLNTYSGKYDENFIPPIKEGAFEFIKKLAEKYEIKIFTSRKLLLVSKWIVENGLEKYISDVTNIKEPSYLILDDRCINFAGDYQKTLNHIDHFVTWYKVDDN